MSSKYLEKFNRNFEEMIVDEGKEAVAKKQSDPIELYRIAKRDGDLLAVVFEYADTDGNLSMKDENGINIVLKKDTLSKDLSYYRERIKDKFLGTEFVVKIDSIDDETRTVFTRSARSTAGATKHRIIGEIQKELKAEHTPILVGRVTKVSDDIVYVDLLCRGILGICNIKYWRKGYVQNLRDEVKVGDLVRFEVMDTLKSNSTKDSSVRGKTGSRDPAFVLSREDITRDPWKDIPSGVKEGDVILVKCVDKPKNTSFWWGQTSLAPGLQVMCDYNTKFPIALKRVYKCKVKRFSVEDRRFQAVPFAVTDIGLDDVASANLRIISSKKVEK